MKYTSTSFICFIQCREQHCSSSLLCIPVQLVLYHTIDEFGINWLLAYDTCSWFPVVLQLSSIKRAKSSMTFIAGEFQFCTRPSILCFDLHKDIQSHFSKSHFGSKYNISPSSCNHTFVLLCPLCSLQSLKMIE